MIDNDPKFVDDFDSVFEADGVEVKRVGPLAPNMNADAERFIQTRRSECLDHFLILGERYLAHLVSEFVTHYHEERPHQSKGNALLCDADDEPGTLKFPTGEVECRQRLGGLLKHYYRAAA